MAQRVSNTPASILKGFQDLVPSVRLKEGKEVVNDTKLAKVYG